jgi:hypothetical protein
MIPKLLAISCITLDTKACPLSDEMDTGIPNQGMVSVSRYLVSSRVFSIHMGKASTHPEEVQINTNRYFHA